MPAAGHRGGPGRQPSIAGFDRGSSTDPVVVPPAPFFAVRGVIVLGCLAAGTVDVVLVGVRHRRPQARAGR